MTAAPSTVPRAAARVAARGLGGLAAALARRWLPLAVLAGCWEAAARTAGSAFFPPPSLIAGRMRELWFSGPAGHLFLTGEATGDVLPSLGRMALGLALSAAAGIVLGLALGRSERALAYLNPILQFARVIPPPTLVPVFIVLFDLGTRMQVASIVFSAVWPVLLNTADGARSVDPTQMDTAGAFRLSGPDRLRFVCRGAVKVRPAGQPDRKPLSGSFDEVRGDLATLAAQGVTEVFVDLNFDPEIGAPGTDPAEALRRAEEALEALAPG